MSAARARWPSAAAIVGLLAILPTGCAVEGAGYDGGYGYGADYYEPYGYDYGGWGDGYFVGPYREGVGRIDGHRDDGHHGGFGGGRPAAHAYRPAPASRGIPSIPSGSRGGGGHGGGGHGGGGRR